MQPSPDGGRAHADRGRARPAITLTGEEGLGLGALVLEEHAAAPGRPARRSVDVGQRHAGIGGGELLGQNDGVIAAGAAVDANEDVVKHDLLRGSGWRGTRAASRSRRCSAAAIRRRVRSTASADTEMASMPALTSSSAYSGWTEGAWPQIDVCSRRCPRTRNQLAQIVGDGRVALVERVRQRLGVAIGAEQQLSEIVGADRDAGHAQRGVALELEQHRRHLGHDPQLKPRAIDQVAISARQSASSRAVRTNGSITWRLWCPASHTRPIASSSKAKTSGSRV